MLAWYNLTLTTEMIGMAMTEAPPELWWAVYYLTEDYANGLPRLNDGLNASAATDYNEWISHPMLLIGNWYFYLEQPWDYKDLLLEYGIDLDAQWTFGMIIHDLLRGKLDAESLELYLTGEEGDGEDGGPVDDDILLGILETYLEGTGELLNNEQTAYLINNEITEEVLWTLLNNETLLDMWADGWPEGGADTLDDGAANVTDEMIVELIPYPSIEQLVQLDMIHIIIL